MTFKLSTLICLALLAGTAVPASAATVTGNVRPGSEETDGTPLGSVVFKAARGEVNRVTFKEVGGRNVITDSAAVLRARGNCDRVNAHKVTCPYTESGVRILLGDRGDRLRVVSGLLDQARGGRGGDRLTGGRGFDYLYGEDGRDILRGGGGGDQLHAGSGKDKLFGAGGDDTLYDDRARQPTSVDVFDGGRGEDTIDYSARRADLDIDLERTRVLRGAEADRIDGIENAVGGHGDDHIAGTNGRNFLAGQGGDDRISGRGGNDPVEGGPGRDRVNGNDGDDVVSGDQGEDNLTGGPGNDLMFSVDTIGIEEDTEADNVNCGTFPDDTVIGGPLDTLAKCEEAGGWERGLFLKVKPTVAGGNATFTANCNSDGGETCHGTAKLEDDDGVDYGTAEFNIPQGEDVPLTIPLTPAGQAALAAGATVTASFTPAEDMVFTDEGSHVTGFRSFLRAG